LLFVSSIFAAPADWEGLYDWNGVGVGIAYNCYEDGWIYGTAGYTMGWAAKVNDAGDKAHGNWWGVGVKFGGQRTGQSKNSPTTGHVVVILNAPGDLTVKISYRGDKTTWMTAPLGDLIYANLNASLRIQSCGILDPSSNATLDGEWLEEDSNTTDHEHAYNCVTGKEFENSYKYKDEDDKTVTGYQVGKCHWGGKVCRSDWFEYPVFGVQLDRLLKDGKKGSMWFDGPYTSITDETNGSFFVADLIDDVRSEQCSQHSDDIAYPFQCHTYDSKSDCEANPFYCKVLRSNDDKCVRIKWMPESS